MFGNEQKVSVARSKQLAIMCSVVLSAFAPASAALACGGVFDVRCNLSHGGLSPNNILNQSNKALQDTGNAAKQAGQDVANAINELQANLLTGPVLEQAITSSHNTAVNGAGPIPPQMRQILTGYASEDSMNRVRFKIGDNGFVNLAHLLEQGGVASAVTLIDVIVFRDPSAANDPAIWAHELTHVDQYQSWGVHDFAIHYVRNWHTVEDPAYAKQNGFWTWYNQTNQRVAPPPPTQVVNGGPPPNLGAFCYVQGYRFGPGPVQIIGSPCFVNLPQGRFGGQVGP